MGKQVSVDIVAQFYACIALRCAGPWFENFFLQGHLSVSTFVSVFRHHAGGRLQLNTQAFYVCGFKESDTVNWCMVVWYRQNVCSM